MISNLIVTSQKFVLFVDNFGLDVQSHQMIKTWLREQGQNSVEIFPKTFNLDFESSDDEFNKNDLKFNQDVYLILQPLEHLLISFKPEQIFQLIDNLKDNSKINQAFLWATTKNINESFVVPFIMYMSDMIITIIDSEHLSILSRKSGGLVTNKFYDYKLSNDKLDIHETKKIIKPKTDPIVDPESLGTFKINLDEEEVKARDALKLPYERTSETDTSSESQIVYTPDADDDFDDEDPDEDLYI